MKKVLIILTILLSFFMLTSCNPTPIVPGEPLRLNDSIPNMSRSKGLVTTYESLTIDHYRYKFTFLGTAEDNTGDTDGWVETTVTPNEWDMCFAQGEWSFEIEAYSKEDELVASTSTTGFVNKVDNPISDIVKDLMDSFTGNGIVVFKDLVLPALYADKTNFYVNYSLYEADGTLFSKGTVPMKEVKEGDGVATLDSFQVEDIPSGEYVIALTILEMNQTTGLYEVKGGSSADGIVIYPNCKSTVTGTFGDTGAYLNALVRTFQTATTFTGKVTSEKLDATSNKTYDNFTFTCTADNPTNIRWFVDGIEQTEILTPVDTGETKRVKVGSHQEPVYGTLYRWKCSKCNHVNEGISETTATYIYYSLSNPKCEGCKTKYRDQKGGLESYTGITNYKTVDDYEYQPIYEDRLMPATGAETVFTVQLSQMGHGYSGATTHYVECIYTDVEGHTSSSTQEMFVGSNYFPNLGASSIFIMGNGNEIAYWVIDISPDSSLESKGFHTYSSVDGEVMVDSDTGIYLTEGLWDINKAVAYDSEGMALIETTNAKKVYINQLNPYINIENVIKAETTETGTIRIRDLKMNSLDWTCNYATGTIDPFKVDTDITVYKLTDEGKDDSSFSPQTIHIDGCTLLETGKTVSGTSNGKNYSYHNDTYQIVGANTERDFEVPEGTYRVQIKINSGARNNAKATYSGNNSYYAGKTEGDLEVIVNVQAHTTQVVTGTLSCNHCLKTDGTI